MCFKLSKSTLKKLKFVYKQVLTSFWKSCLSWKTGYHTVFIYGNCRITIFLQKKMYVVIFHYQTVLFGSNSRRNCIESFFNVFFWNCMKIVWLAFTKKMYVVIFHYQTVLFGSNSRRNCIESFFNVFFWNCMKIVWLAFFHTFDVGNCKISIFGVGKSKISIFGLRRSTRVVFQLHLCVTLPFQAFLLVWIGFLYKTAQKPLKNRSNLAWKTVQKSPQEISGFWAVL